MAGGGVPWGPSLLSFCAWEPCCLDQTLSHRVQMQNLSQYTDANVQ